MKKYVLPLLFVLCLTQTQSQADVGRYERLYEKSGGRIKVYYDSIVGNRLQGGTVIQTLKHPRDVQLDIRDDSCWEVTTVIENGPSSNRVDWVIIGDGYTDAELADYAADVDRIVAGWFATEPFDTYVNYFNVHRVDVVSNESGIDDLNADPPVYKDTELDIYRQEHIIYLGNRPAAEAAAACAPACDIILALANTDWYGGTGADGLAVASSDNYYALGLVLHEMGHSFGHLADEYYYDGETYTGGEPSLPNVSIYTVAEMASLQTKWHRWLDLPHIDTFEGAYYNEFGIYRPTEQSTMNWLENPFYEVNIEQLIFRIYQDVSPIDDATANDQVQTEGTTFFATAAQPVGHDLSFQWALDQNDVLGAVNSEFTPDYESLEPGLHEVSVTITDDTSKVRDESKRNELLSATRRWELAITSSKGILEITPQYCTANDNLQLRLLDEDLKGDSSQYVSISTTAGDSETVLLTEQSSDSGILEVNVNTVPDVPVVEDGFLNVTVGDVITATYIDLDNGSGQSKSVSDKSLVYSALFNPAVSNASFEDGILDMGSWGWYAGYPWGETGGVWLETNAQASWQDSEPTPYGNNMLRFGWSASLFQEIGTWSPNTDYEVTVWMAERYDDDGDPYGSDLVIELWGGGATGYAADSQAVPGSEYEVSLWDNTGAIWVDYQVFTVADTGSTYGDVTAILNTSAYNAEGLSEGDPLWVRLDNPVVLQDMSIDNIRVEPVDSSAPFPDPADWEVAPYATATDSITMVAETALDQSGVEYLFECVSGNGHNSPWRDSCTYTDTSLSFLDTVTYRVKTRDKSASKNESQYSTSSSAVVTYLADVDTNGSVDIRDFADISGQWMQNNCDGLSRCNRTDLNADSFVDLIDLTLLIEDWMRSNNI